MSGEVAQTVLPTHSEVETVLIGFDHQIILFCVPPSYSQSAVSDPVHDVGMVLPLDPSLKQVPAAADTVGSAIRSVPSHTPFPAPPTERPRRAIHRSGAR